MSVFPLCVVGLVFTPCTVLFMYFSLCSLSADYST